MSDLIIIPYVEIDGKWTIPDTAMKGLYRLMLKEKTANVTFYSGTVQNEDQFVLSCKSSNQHTVIILLPDGKPAGIVWVNGYAHGSAQVHFCMFRSIWGSRSVEAGKKAVDYLFGLTKPDGEPLIRMLLGLTPVEYELAINFIKEVGVTVIGTVPHFVWNHYKQRTMGAVISYIERRD